MNITSIALPFLAGLALGAILGWLHHRRGARDSLDWWNRGFRDGFEVAVALCGRNPLEKPTEFRTLDELAEGGRVE